MTTGCSGAGPRRRSAVDLTNGQVRGFLKLFSDWIFQSLCSGYPLEVQERLAFSPGDRKPNWRWFLERLPKDKEEASVGLSSDLDAVLLKLSSGESTEFNWLGPWSNLFDTFPEARALLAFAGLEFAEAFRKVKEPCGQEYLDKAIQAYHRDEQTLVDDVAGSYPAALYSNYESPCIQLGKTIIGIWLHGLHPHFEKGHFGPGSVAEKLDHIDRATATPSWRPTYHNLIEPCHFSSREEWREWELTHDWANPPQTYLHSASSRMVAVPKTATKPRLIAAEPAARSWLQQSLFEILKERMQHYPYLDITDQTHNQRLCLQGLATIDQSRASDRVSDALVRRLFPADWVEALEYARTDTVQCLCGETHTLSKFAGMGAATTFPVETLVFAACALSRAYLEYGGSPWDDRHAIEDWLKDQCSKDVWGFYGDDAIVPNNLFDSIIDEYRRWGFIPNFDKSYSGSDRFRESCGVMAIQTPTGEWVEVSPARFSTWPDASTKISKSASTVETLNRLRLKILLLSGESVNCERTRWTEIPEQKMLWDYSDMKGLLWSPTGFGWWDGTLLPATAEDYQDNWSVLEQQLGFGTVYRSKCVEDGEIPSSALHVCLSHIQGGAYVSSETCGLQEIRRWVYPTEPSVLRDPRPFQVKAVLRH